MATTKSATASGAGTTMAEAASEVRSELGQIDERLRVFVKERPIMALLSAIAAGYVVGRVLRRRG